MKIYYVIPALLIFFFSLFFEYYLTVFLREKKVTQVQKAYGPARFIETRKGSVPSMGGIGFCVSAIVGVSLYSFTEASFFAQAEILILPLGCALIGFIDDWLKYSGNSSEGLSSIGKLGVQTVMALFWSVFIFFRMDMEIHTGFIIQSPVFFVFLLTFFTVGMMNAVNVTDGLDGLAGGAAIISLFGLLFLTDFDHDITAIILTGIALLAGFLWHNCHPAKIFMGDTGSHFIAGLIVAICVYSGRVFYLVPAGFLFGIEILSVCIQLIAIYSAGRKIFLMSPVHHHFELVGWSESRIVTRFWLIHGSGFVIISMIIDLILNH